MNIDTAHPVSNRKTKLDYSATKENALIMLLSLKLQEFPFRTRFYLFLSSSLKRGHEDDTVDLQRLHKKKNSLKSLVAYTHDAYHARKWKRTLLQLDWHRFSLIRKIPGGNKKYFVARVPLTMTLDRQENRCEMTKKNHQ